MTICFFATQCLTGYRASALKTYGKRFHNYPRIINNMKLLNPVLTSTETGIYVQEMYGYVYFSRIGVWARIYTPEGCTTGKCTLLYLTC